LQVKQFLKSSADVLIFLEKAFFKKKKAADDKHLDKIRFLQSLRLVLGLIQVTFVAESIGAEFNVLLDPFSATFIQVTTLMHPF
jgi:hypothetical protein